MDPPQAENISRLAELIIDTNTTTLKWESFVSRIKFADALDIFEKMPRATTYVA